VDDLQYDQQGAGVRRTKKHKRQSKQFQRVLPDDVVSFISASACLDANSQAYAGVQTGPAWVSCSTPLPLNGTLQTSFCNGSLNGFLNLQSQSLTLWLSNTVRIDVECDGAPMSREPGRIKVNGRPVWRKSKLRK
jgi:hypothetical protein